MKISLQILLVFFSAGNCMAGTPYLVKEICSPNTTGCYLQETASYKGPQEFTPVGDILFFSADDGIHGRELWKSDGTAGGTVMVKNINAQYESPYSWSSTPLDLIEVNGTLFFTAWDGVHGRELWKSDGTMAGTVLVRDIDQDDDPNYSYSRSAHLDNLITFNGALYFLFGTYNQGKAIWRSDGTFSGTHMVSINEDVAGMFPTEDALYFISGGYHIYTLLWKTDWFQSAEVLVKNFSPQYDGIGFSYGAYINNTLYFSAGGMGWSELWKTDGTTAGTIQVKDFNLGLKANRELAIIEGSLFFMGNTNKDDNRVIGLWRSNGSDSGTFVIEDSFPCKNPDGPGNLIAIGETLYFTTCDRYTWGDHYYLEGFNIWKTDGTPKGATRVRNLSKNIFAGDNPEEMIKINGILYFPARTRGSLTSNELWMSDGTNRGTVQVADIYPGSPPGSSPKNLTNVNGTLFFTAIDRVHGLGLWAFKNESEGHHRFPWSIFLPAILPATK